MEKTVIITGASGSMGEAASCALAGKGFNVIMACRNLAKAEAVRDRILRTLPDARLELRCLRLDSFESIYDFAEAMEGREIHGLFNNAGVMPKDYRLTEDGFEQTIAVNYLGPYLLTRLLQPRFEPGANIVNMVSLTCNLVHERKDFINVRPEDHHQLRSYAASKLALMYFSIEFARRYPQLRMNVADPGIVNSNMISMGRWFDPLADVIFRPLCKSPEAGAAPAVRAMCTNETLQLFKGSGHCPIPERFQQRRESSAALWKQTEEIFKAKQLIHL